MDKQIITSQRPLSDLVARQAKIAKRLRLSPIEASHYTGICPRTLKRYRLERRIPFYRLGHCKVVFDVRDLDAWLAKNRVEAIG